MKKRKRPSLYSRGRWQVECERCGIARGTPPPVTETCADIGAGVHMVMKGLGLSGLQWTAELAEAWPLVVGEQVAGHTRPGRMLGTELVVYVDSSVWLSELQRYGLKGLCAKVQDYCGKQKVRGIRLQLDPDK